MRKRKDEKKKLKIGHVASHFLDSGSFTLWTTTAKNFQLKHPNKGLYGYYYTKAFKKYMDDYAKFIKKYDGTFIKEIIYVSW